MRKTELKRHAPMARTSIDRGKGKREPSRFPKVVFVPDRVISRKSLTALWSKLVKARDGRCMLAGHGVCSGQLEAHHIHSCRSTSTRYDLQNGLTVCKAHHDWIPQNKAESDRLIASIIGRERFAYLESRHFQVQKDTAEFRDECRAKLVAA